MVPHDSEKYKETHYFKCFDETIRYPDLEEAKDDLVSIFEQIQKTDLVDTINNYYEEYKSIDQIKCVTMIWTSDKYIQDLINCAIIVDAVTTYDYDREKFKFYFDRLEELSEPELDYASIISKYIKFIRLLNSSIVDKGTSLNDSDRITYRAINRCILQDIEVGQTLRVINWMWTSEDLEITHLMNEKYGYGRIIVE